MSPQKKRTPKTSSRSVPPKVIDDRHLRVQKLLDLAFEARNPNRQLSLARQVLDIDPDCAAAHLIVANYAANDEEALPLLEQAVAAAAKELGEDGFRDFAGQFWGFHETRPYMQARLELAECLWGLGRVDDAIKHFQQMLELNPHDNQGCRYRLVSALLQTERLNELTVLLGKYPEDVSAEWCYTRALLAFKREGDSEPAQIALQAAQQMNEHVPAYLVGAKRIPRKSPDYISPGQESEAVSFVAEFLSSWRSTPGAIPWVRKTLKLDLPTETPKKRPVAWKRVQQVLLDVPQAKEAEWETDLFALPQNSASGTRGWAMVIVNSSTGEPMLVQTWDDRPLDSELWSRLVDTMQNPEHAEPHRPQGIQLLRKSLVKAWSSKLGQLNVRCELVDELPQIDALKEAFQQKLASSSHPGHEQPADDTDLEQLPQEFGEVWRAAVRKLPAWIQIDGQICRPTVRLVLDASNDCILATELLDHEPPEDWLWQGIRSAMWGPSVGEPRRPSVVQLSPEESLYEIGTRLESIGVRCVVNEDSRPVDELIDDLADTVAGPRRIKALIRIPGIKPSQLENFFSAAADFYRTAPWKHVPGDTILRIDTDAFTSGPWYAVIMGQSGMELGIVLYEDLKLLRTIIAGRLSDEENARRTSALSVSFGEVFDIAPEDGDAIEQHRWPVAAEEAHPMVLRTNPGLVLRLPLAWELELLTACLRAIPAFIHQKGCDESSHSAATGTRDIILRLTRMPDC